MEKNQIGILVVDDVNSIRLNLKDALNGLGYTSVVISNSAVDAIEILRTRPIHLIFCDWRMSPGSGIDLLTYLREKPEFRNIAFVMVTGESSENYVFEAIKLGVDGYVIKPFNANNIEKKLNEALNRRKNLIEGTQK